MKITENSCVRPNHDEHLFLELYFPTSRTGDCNSQGINFLHQLFLQWIGSSRRLLGIWIPSRHKCQMQIASISCINYADFFCISPLARTLASTLYTMLVLLMDSGLILISKNNLRFSKFPMLLTVFCSLLFFLCSASHFSYLQCNLAEPRAEILYSLLTMVGNAGYQPEDLLEKLGFQV